MTVSASGAAIEPVIGDYDKGLHDLTFFYSYVAYPHTEDMWDSAPMSDPGASVHIGSNVGDCSTSDDWSIPFDNSDQFSMEVYTTASPNQYVDAAARIRVRYKIVRPDDKVHVRGTLELDLVNGDGVKISEDVTVTVGPLSETITMVEKGKKGEKWEYKRAKDGIGNIKHMTINWKNGKFDIRMDKADLSELTDPEVTISIQIGDDVGEETILMREKKHHWDYKAHRD